MTFFLKIPKESDNVLSHVLQFEQFWNLYQQGALSPCWLLIGQSGVGKATFAYQFAGKILAQNTQNPCGLKDTVVKRQISVGSYPNLFVLEPKPTEDGLPGKEIVMDDVRHAIKFLRQSPTIPGWRVVIIDSINELNRFSANALLKILEEPPQKTLILMICHSLGTVLPTIRSRCQKMFFSPLTSTDFEKTLADPLDEKIFDLCQGSLGLYHQIQEAGGHSFIDACEQAVQAAYTKNTNLYQKFSETYGKQNLHLNCFTRIIGPILYRQTLKNLPNPVYANAYSAVLQFLNASDQAHLDPTQKLLALFLIIEKNANSF